MTEKGCILLLAAGESKRFGGIKQLALLNGSMLLQNSINVINELKMDSYVALGANILKIRKATDFLKSQIIQVIDWEKGMGESIASAVSQILKNNKPDYIIISVADQPFLEKNIFDDLLCLHENAPSKIIYSKYDQGFGVPMLFPLAFFDNLLELKNNRGAKSFVSAIKENCLSVDFKNGHIDIDTKHDLMLFSKN